MYRNQFLIEEHTVVNTSKPYEWPELQPLTTVVVPTFNESDNVMPLVERVRRAFNGRPAEILFVDDSTDMKTIEAIDMAGGLFVTASFQVANPVITCAW